MISKTLGEGESLLFLYPYENRNHYYLHYDWENEKRNDYYLH